MLDLDQMMSIINYCKRKFHAVPSYKGKHPEASIVLRHGNGGRWYGIFLKEGPFLVRCSSEHAEVLRDVPGFKPAHFEGVPDCIMVNMDGSADKELIRLLILESFRLSDDPENSELYMLDDVESRDGSQDEPAVFFTEEYSDVPLTGLHGRRNDGRSGDVHHTERSEADITSRLGRMRIPQVRRVDGGIGARHGGYPADIRGREKPSGTFTKNRFDNLPPVLRRLRQVYVPPGELGSIRSAALEFYLQARIAADYEDDYEWSGSFAHYRPVYRDMSDEQLRGYFSWRTAFRQGRCGLDIPGSGLAFVRIHISEILCGAGCTPEEGFDELVRIRDMYKSYDEEFSRQISVWIHDYIIYYHLKEHVTDEFFPELKPDHDLAVFAGVADSEPGEYFGVLSRISSYRIARSSFLSKHRDESAKVLRRAVEGFSEKMEQKYGRKLVDMCFSAGLKERRSAGLFRHAVFFDWRSPGRTGAEYEQRYLGASHVSLNDWQEETFTVDEIRTYARNAGGRWEVCCPYEFEKPNKMLGHILRETDRQLRERFDPRHPLKEGSYPEEIGIAVSEILERYFAELEEASRPHIEIDMSVLDSIRKDAAITRDSLIVGDENGYSAEHKDDEYGLQSGFQREAGRDGHTDEVHPGEEGIDEQESVSSSGYSSPPPDESRNGQLAGSFDAEKSEPEKNSETEAEQLSFSIESGESCTTEKNGEAKDSREKENAESPENVAQEPDDEEETPEHFLLRSLLDGTPYDDYFLEKHLSVSITADRANEIMIDVIGDTVIEFNGEHPEIVDDYREDVREWLGGNS
ncbi:MAG: TerB N-terminal domain-containing protein [Anaerovoracaceae bacterium]|jgi:predicted DNA-binding protein (MmcQ/YjbR family)